jgi:hypothetical protein
VATRTLWGVVLIAVLLVMAVWAVGLVFDLAYAAVTYFDTITNTLIEGGNRG